MVEAETLEGSFPFEFFTFPEEEVFPFEQDRRQTINVISKKTRDDSRMEIPFISSPESFKDVKSAKKQKITVRKRQQPDRTQADTHIPQH